MTIYLLGQKAEEKSAFHRPFLPVPPPQIALPPPPPVPPIFQQPLFAAPFVQPQIETVNGGYGIKNPLLQCSRTSLAELGKEFLANTPVLIEELM